MRYRTFLAGMTGVALATAAHAGPNDPVYPSISVADHSQATGVSPQLYGQYNYDHSVSTDAVPTATLSEDHSFASAAIGEMHVRATMGNGNGVVDPAYAEDLPLSDVPSNNNFQRSASAGWTDVFTINSNQVSNGFYNANIQIDGTNDDMRSVQSGGGFGALAANVSFNFSTMDGNGDLTSIANFTASELSYGGTPNVFVDGVGQASLFGNWSILVPFISGQQVYLTASSRCSVQANSAPVGAMVDRVCDLAHSVYWGGMSDINDGNGNAVTDASIQSASAFDYSVASPSASPSPAPEPGLWAMFVIGFAFVGGTLRRRDAGFRTIPSA